MNLADKIKRSFSIKKKDDKYNKKDTTNYLDDCEKHYTEEPDEDFLDQHQYDFPHLKVAKWHYFGGMKRELWIPMSVPHRCIIEANPPRQGYSHLTWQTINEYYLKKAIPYDQFKEILVNCKNLALQAYAENREEQDFMTNSTFEKASHFVWFLCVTSVFFLVISELVDIPYQHFRLINLILFSVTIALNFLLSLYNFQQPPENKIFMQYEQNYRELVQKYFQRLNEQLENQHRDHLEFSISTNPNNALWIEVAVPKRLRQPFRHEEVQKHVDYLNEREREEFEKYPDGENDFKKIKIRQIILGRKEDFESQEKNESNSSDGSMEESDLDDKIQQVAKELRRLKQMSTDKKKAKLESQKKMRSDESVDLSAEENMQKKKKQYSSVFDLEAESSGESNNKNTASKHQDSQRKRNSLRNKDIDPRTKALMKRDRSTRGSVGNEKQNSQIIGVPNLGLVSNSRVELNYSHQQIYVHSNQKRDSFHSRHTNNQRNHSQQPSLSGHGGEKPRRGPTQVKMPPPSQGLRSRMNLSSQDQSSIMKHY